jgi:tetratricopeptide (TPR) repeat protein
MAEFESVTREPQFRLLFLPDAVRVCLAAGEIGQGRRPLSGPELSAPRFRYASVTAAAAVAEAAGEPAEALALYSDAAERWAEFGIVLEEGQALLGKARCLIELGRAEEAAQPLGEARSIFSTLGAAPLEAEADSLLATAA